MVFEIIGVVGSTLSAASAVHVLLARGKKVSEETKDKVVSQIEVLLETLSFCKDTDHGFMSYNKYGLGRFLEFINLVDVRSPAEIKNGWDSAVVSYDDFIGGRIKTRLEEQTEAVRHTAAIDQDKLPFISWEAVRRTNEHYPHLLELINGFNSEQMRQSELVNSGITKGVYQRLVKLMGNADTIARKANEVMIDLIEISRAVNTELRRAAK